tara:strand:+ start:7850 stop:8602 length:753 start_codon:yes stop_codon:yes gene_type:complete
MKNILILLRHGESQWNLDNRFTGWTDVDLTRNGEEEAIRAGKLIKEKGLEIKKTFVSYLRRSVRTSELCLNHLKDDKVEVLRDWRLNERHYGNLQGLNKAETAKKYGEEQVKVWRRSYDIPPPPMDTNDERHPSKDPLYSDVDPKLLPNSESLKDTLKRVMPVINKLIIPEIKNSSNLMIVAHGNSLRAIIKVFKKISDKAIINLNIPTGMPYVLEFDTKLKVVNDYYLGNAEEILLKAKEVENQGKSSN